MNLFYLRHFFLSHWRSPSFDGEVFALIILGVLFGGSAPTMYNLLDTYAEQVSQFFSLPETNYHLLILLYLMLDLVIRLVFRRPYPQLRHYVLWGNYSKQISWQYMITSLFGIMPFVLAISVLTVALKSTEWIGGYMPLTIILCWLANHFLALIAQFSKKPLRSVLLLLVGVVFAIQWFVPTWNLPNAMPTLRVPAVVLPVVVLVAYATVKNVIESRQISDEKSEVGSNLRVPMLSFKNPILQLEWALVARNKRTRSNLLLGLCSIMILPFLMDVETDRGLAAIIFFLATSFFIIQHGVYSLGWEGSYFDFLISNISPRSFMQTRYFFYAGTCLVGLLLALLPALLKGFSISDLLMICLYNLGITIPLVLYRSVLNDTKIVLTENSFMNYNGMLTGPIFVSSFLLTLLPLILYGIGVPFLGDNAIFILGALGIAGLLANRPLITFIANRFQQKKYHLSQSFKS